MSFPFRQMPTWSDVVTRLRQFGCAQSDGDDFICLDSHVGRYIVPKKRLGDRISIDEAKTILRTLGYSPFDILGFDITADAPTQPDDSP